MKSVRKFVYSTIVPLLFTGCNGTCTVSDSLSCKWMSSRKTVLSADVQDSVFRSPDGGVIVARSGPDGDCLVHALIDALLSAAGMPDIGTLFPDTDPRYRDIDSTILLSEVVRRLRDSNFKIHNVAATVMLERPKLAHDIPMMRVKLANLLGISSDRIAIAAKTGEGLPPVGTGEAIASVVAVTLI